MIRQAERSKLVLIPIWLFVFLLGGQKLSLAQKDAQMDILPFELIKSEKSGITFSNDLTPDVSTGHNLFDFDYFYNGAGVAVADFDNDGLEDVFFCGNQVKNQIYRNLGNFKFENKSKSSGINRDKYWSNGVTVVDINDDGLLDIYVSQGGPYSRIQRENLLYVNQGDFRFVNEAVRWGLADNGFSTQSVFFDYDQDGDLDCFVGNENGFFGMEPISFYQAVGQNENIFHESSCHLYENRNGYFQDVSKEAGVLKPSFALGICVSDLNDDGLLDIYVSNDYFIPDALYINKGNGRFEDEIQERTDQMSFYGMGLDIGDIDNDEDQDIVVLDMASSDHVRSKTLMKSMNVENFRLLTSTLNFPYQYMFNALQINNGKGEFRNVAQYAGIAKTDWSWTALLQDFDLDGKKDIYVTNGYRKYALDNDFQNQVSQTKAQYEGQIPLSIKKELYEQMPSERIANVFYKNLGQRKFEDRAEQFHLNQDSYSIGAAIGDFDNDGDPDIIVNNIDEQAFLLKNNAVESGKSFIKIKLENNKIHRFKKVSLESSRGRQMIESKIVRGYLSSSTSDIFLAADSDSNNALIFEVVNGEKFIIQELPANKTYQWSEFQIKALEYDASNLKHDDHLNWQRMDADSIGIGYSHIENLYDDFQTEILLPFKQSTQGPYLHVNDINDDGKDDLLITGAMGQSTAIYVQTDSGFELYEDPYLSKLPKYEFGEVNIINSDSGRLMIRVPSGNQFTSTDSTSRLEILNLDNPKESQIIGLGRFNGSKSASIDFDNDGDLDLIIGGRIQTQKYPLSPGSLLLEYNDGKFSDVTSQLVPDLADFGMVNDITVTDVNGDGLMDFLCVGEWTEIGIFVNTGSGFEQKNKDYQFENLKGFWQSIEQADLNADGKPDFVIGNLGTNHKYKASKEKPFKIFADDFDENGTWDLVLSQKYMDTYVPLRGKECSTDQMPFISEKFESYDLFANASMEDVYGQENMDNAFSAEINTFESVILMSGDQGYTIVPLPSEAQLFPVMDIEVVRHSDEMTDIILLGNMYESEVETPRLDAGRGLILRLQDDRMIPIMPSKSGIDLSGNIKSGAIIDHQGFGLKLLAVGVNDGDLRVFSLGK